MHLTLNCKLNIIENMNILKKKYNAFNGTEGYRPNPVSYIANEHVDRGQIVSFYLPHDGHDRRVQLYPGVGCVLGIALPKECGSDKGDPVPVHILGQGGGTIVAAIDPAGAAVKRFDLLTASTTPGYLVAVGDALDAGTGIIMGRALEANDRNKLIEIATASLDLLCVPDPALDTDGDGVPDVTEAANGTDPDDTDSDDDGVDDGAEATAGTDPLDDDSDDDGVSDGDEATGGTNPLNPDTDADGVNDSADTDPLDPAVQ